MGETRRAARRPLVAWSLTVATLVVLAAALVLLGLNASRTDTGRIGFYILLSVGVLAYAGAGGLIARRVPGNAIGWLLSLTGLSLTMAMLTEQYALYGLATAPGAVPAAKVAVVAAGLVAQQFQAGIMISGGIIDALDEAGVSYPNPLGVLPQHGWFSGLLAGIFVLAVVTGLLVVASVFVRRRGASTERRQQLAWLGYVGLLTVVWIVLMVLANFLLRGRANGVATA